MSKLVIPFPPPLWQPEKIPPGACWWRHAMIHKNELDNLYQWLLHGEIENDAPPEKAWDGVSAVTLEWYDNLNTIIDAGMDTPNVWSVCQVYVRPIDYIDLLSDKRPAESFHRITRYGDWIHPGAHAMCDLDWKERLT